MFEEDWGFFGIIFYIIVMAGIFAIPIIVGLLSGLFAMQKRKPKLAMLLWSLILFSPVIFVFLLAITSPRGWIGQTLVGQPTYTIYLVGGILPFAIPIWIVGTLFLCHTYYAHENALPHTKKWE